MTRGTVLSSLVLGIICQSMALADDGPSTPSFDRQVMPLLKVRCVKCHGPAKREAKLSLASPNGLARGGKTGDLVVAGRLDESLLWTRVADEEMPPDEPLTADEKRILERWIEAGAPGLPKLVAGTPEAADHWAFAPLGSSTLPAVRSHPGAANPIDRLLLPELEAEGLTLGAGADRSTLIRRVSFDLTGVPPTPAEVAAYLTDDRPNAYGRMVERYLASPRYGERWGKYWLDAAGYADSNGYFAADSDRPLAYRYRDYVIRSWNQDKPLDQFVREQLAGDELSGFRPGSPVTPEVVDQLVAGHYLRNSQDGTGESDGNPDELRADRYAVLEGAIEILGSSLFGMTFQCARCHDHKFEPITQQDYYQLQAILYPAFPVDGWVKPNERVVEAPVPAELAEWTARTKGIDGQIASLKAAFRVWSEQNRSKGDVRFQDAFDDTPGRLAPRWIAKAPADDMPFGTPPVNIDSELVPGAVVKDGTLKILESGTGGNRFLSTSQAFDWTPDNVGGWIQVTFDLVARKVKEDGVPAARVGYYLALADYQDKTPAKGGNVLIDGNPSGGAEVHVDYPGADSRAVGTIGGIGYEPGHRFGVRITNQGEGKFRLEHVYDWQPEGRAVTLTAADLPDGGFGFEYCCDRSFVVDNLLIEGGEQAPEDSNAQARKAKLKEYTDALKSLDSKRGGRPGKIAWVHDLKTTPPEVHLLLRGNYASRGPVVEPGVPSVLRDSDHPFQVVPPFEGSSSTGARLALANWITRPGSRSSALLARVTANRIWQYHFGVGLVATPENLGYSGSPPTHPALLDELARILVDSGWSAKALHRLIVTSNAYRQVSSPDAKGEARDPDNRLLGRYPMRRLDAEAIRDAMLAASGELDGRMGGPYVAANRNGNGTVAVDESVDGAHRRSVYLQQRRTHVVGVLEDFDAPSIVINCTRRNATTIPLQSLSLLNSDFVLARSRALAKRLEREAGPNAEGKIAHAFLVAVGRPPTEEERVAAMRFVDAQPAHYPGQADAAERSWADFCQALLASNAFLYVE
ncbi:Planctomycete cytochrome C [Singulisphaera sp. GP187]|uniref:PSD1 and planctomycete cytochrome C domain-containing protein n=1 Tax=Singulisphaera sp. GP187 TaxID=1882752 RepID=UPI0009267161|nr:PSD1 and planctomycete cytochrome C domain-containing protein [Singulisphaera sp. GP187]SIO64949.1 Planctomycete cytochrome C [Singulisphaera sp. GP187]